MDGKYSAYDIACYIVNKCIDDGVPISNLQLQKILYFCQTEYLKNTGSFLMIDDFEAWPYGPVIPDVYRMFSVWGGLRIVSKEPCDDFTLDHESKSLIDEIVESKRELYPFDLVKETHADGQPWAEIYNNGAGDENVIPKSLIREAVCG